MLNASGQTVTMRASDKAGVLVANHIIDATLTYTDRSGTIAAGGTAQQMMPLLTTRKKLFIQNPSTATEDLWIRFTGTAAVGGAGSIQLYPGDSWQEDATGVTTQAISVVAT